MPPSRTTASHSPGISPSLAAAMLMLLLGTGLHAVSLQSILQAPNLVSVESWGRLVTVLGGEILRDAAGNTFALLPFLPIWGIEFCISLVAWFGGGWWIARQRNVEFSTALSRWGVRGWTWWMLGGMWEIGRLLAFSLGWTGAEQFLLASPEIWQALLLAGWSATFLTLAKPSVAAPVSLPAPAAESAMTPAPSRSMRILEALRSVPLPLWCAMGAYFLVFGTMNWQLWKGLLIPHGDSAMYEEHLWNLTHGKGFRSFIDQGLFLGEHIQVIHVLLLPIYLLWPSHVLLEWCESAALALGALPVFWMATRHTGSPRAGLLLAGSYLLSFPMQRLDISIDFKTFRPEAFGIPLLLFTLDALDRRQWKALLVWLVLTLLVKEDYALVLAPLGLWILFVVARDADGATDRAAPTDPPSKNPPSKKFWRWLGTGLVVFGAVYLVLAVKVIIPAFRAGNIVHYTRYFAKFGDSMEEIVWNILTQPGLLFSELFTAENALFATSLLLPAGFIALLSPTRLAVGLPLFGALCLNEIARNAQHHFHAPLVSIVYWAAAAGLGNVPRIQAWCRDRWGRQSAPESALMLQSFAARFALTCALFTGVFYSISPLGLAFWDSGSPGYWRVKYVPGERAKHFPRVLEQIPPESRVASTDFVHPRFTHYERSYDYSAFRPEIPADADYLVIDVHGPYSKVTRPEDVDAYRKHPERWELLPDTTEGYFLIFRSRP